MRLRQVRCLQSCRYLLKLFTQRWFTPLTLVPAPILDNLKVLNKRLLLYYIIEGSEVSSISGALSRQSPGIEVFGQYDIEERALALGSTGQDLSSRSASPGEKHRAEAGRAQLPKTGSFTGQSSFFPLSSCSEWRKRLLLSLGSSLHNHCIFCSSRYRKSI